jgi:hypothetical protein
MIFFLPWYNIILELFGGRLIFNFFKKLKYLKGALCKGVLMFF